MLKYLNLRRLVTIISTIISTVTVAHSSNEVRLLENSQLGLRNSQTSLNGNLTFISTFTYKNSSWTVYEDLTLISGSLHFISSTGNHRTFDRYLEAGFNEKTSVPFYLGLNRTEINTALPDILADALLANGEPSEPEVRNVVPQVLFEKHQTYIGNIQANDTMFVRSDSATRNHYPLRYVDITAAHKNYTYNGLLNGWMPVVRGVFRLSEDADDWYETMLFGDVESTEPFIIPSWSRTSHIVDGQVQESLFSREYPASDPQRLDPTPSEFYRALLTFADYWGNQLEDVAPMTLPDKSWVDISKHSFAVELITRYGGVYPKYGAYDRDYAGSEYDGFQDIFTSSVLANLLWGRFTQAKAVITNYFDMFVSPSGDINMRGPEIPQFGLSLSLLATYFKYTNDIDLLSKYQSKIIAWTRILEELHDKSLTLSPIDLNYGLIAGWSESDSSIGAAYNPAFYIRPYWNNNAFAARGLKDIASVPLFSSYAAKWTVRASAMIAQTEKTLGSVIRYDMNPPYVPVLPNTTLTVRESMESEEPSPQMWSHRVYSELLQSSTLTPNLTHALQTSMRAYGSTSLGIVANVGAVSTTSRDILGFISYGHAISLLLANRVDEFILFLYAHRYHDYTRGDWIATEVAPTSGVQEDTNPFCVPAQLTMPIALRAALVLEHPDEEILYLGRGVPRAWLATGDEIGIKHAPTRWGKVDFSMRMDNRTQSVTASVTFAGTPPHEVYVKIGLPEGCVSKGIMVGDSSAEMVGEEARLVMDPKQKSVSIQGRFTLQM
ncbi:uncharacterized protein RAG0_06744 [Rhynchosporium agropyri]|uniref:Glutaminase A n=1 Tax=Rhynchosporium agropyri TaxID=914238 RepID=A0A1E1KII8_9HELO|nr:uncharacterized protein RAG0_06744 [Rhynchosporium agropyri]